METSLLHRREGIIISTIEAINEVGFQNLSTKIIAKREGVSEGTLFRHFKNKSDILLAVLDHFSQYDDDIIEATINKKLNPIETIKYFICEYAEYYENYPAITVILQNYDSLLYDVCLSKKMKTIVIKRWGFIFRTIKEGQDQGIIKPYIDCQSLVDLIIGGFKQICLRWRMDKFKFSLKDKTMLMVNVVLEEFSVK
jgi:AcrR family transcriptional regulator